MGKVMFYTPLEYCNLRGIALDETTIMKLTRRAIARVKITGEPTSQRHGGNLQRRMVTAYTLATLDNVRDAL